jgi:transcriptional regulator with XRE-family HTH domain
MPQAVQYALVVDYLVKLRHERRLHQADLAKLLGKDQQFVSRVENRLRTLDVIEFYAYVRALGADPVEALAGIYGKLSPDFRL